MCETEILLLWGYKNPNFNLCSLFDQMVPDKWKVLVWLQTVSFCVVQYSTCSTLYHVSFLCCLTLQQ